MKHETFLLKNCELQYEEETVMSNGHDQLLRSMEFISPFNISLSSNMFLMSNIKEKNYSISVLVHFKTMEIVTGLPDNVLGRNCSLISSIIGPCKCGGNHMI